ncbi:MAG: MFS transporter [Methylovirgula sp.]|uniref:MFS transporter n=1 Tax=Methylovirgula sp. TaxID=1978224 RepID=UPI00307650C0
MSETSSLSERAVSPSFKGASLESRRWPALFVMLAGTLLSPVDFFIVNIALPSIQSDLKATPAAIELVLSGYACAYAVLLITGGRLGDIFGRRLIFLIGIIGFALASLACGIASSANALVISRIVQGGFAAILMPQSLATIRVLFPEHERPKAMGYYAATFGLGAILGQLLGGLLVAINPFGLGWRSIFLVNLPIIAVVIPLSIILLRETRDDRAQRLDIGGVILLAAALTAMIIPIVEGPEHGWPVWVITLLTSAFPLFIIFWFYEKRVVARGRDPLFPPGILAAPGLVRGLTATLLYNAFAAFFLVFSIYQQDALGRTPLEAGLAIMPFAFGFAISPLFSAGLTKGLGRRAPTFAMIVLATGMFSSAIAAFLDFGTVTSLTTILIGIGQGFALPTLVRTVVERIDGRWAGLSAGLVSSILQISGSLSIALIGGLFYAMMDGRSSPLIVAHAFTVAVAAIGVSLLVAAWLIDGVRPAQHPPFSSGSRRTLQ